MGTRIHALFDHHVAEFRRREEVLTRLEATIPAALAVRDYWYATAPHAPHDDRTTWSAIPHRTSTSIQDAYYRGPGSLQVWLGDQTAVIIAGGRWRGFLSIPTLREVHLAALRSIAAALAATQIVYYGDDDTIDEMALFQGKSLSECTKVIEQKYGPVQPAVEFIDPRITAAAEHRPPAVWYIEQAAVANGR